MVPKTVIIVDNDKFQRQLADMLLAVDNYNIVEFSNAKDTLQYLKEHTPDIALLATDLSDISGADICSKMKRNSRLKDVPVILISSQLQHDTVNALARAVHADLVLEKPLGDKHLKEEVRKLLGQAEASKVIETSDDILILEDIANSNDQDFFYMDTTLVEQTIPIKETLVPKTDLSSDSLPPIDEAASVEIQNIFIDSTQEIEDNISEEMFAQDIDIIDAIEKDLQNQNLSSDDLSFEEDKTNINEVMAEQESY
ncbi:MAG TPA: response regulator, partial [Trueperaceae bacterium]|nr:response regulator [Trueperaceae bacterium]